MEKRLSKDLSSKNKHIEAPKRLPNPRKKPLPGWFQPIYTGWVGFTFITTMLVFFLFLMPVQLFPGKAAHAASNFLLRTWSSLWSAICGLRFRQKGRKDVDTKQTAVIVTNHTSFLDTAGVYKIIRHRFKTLAKKSLLKIPVLGLIFRTSGIMVDRSSKESRNQSFERMVNAIKSGTSVLIFPEGTQNRTEFLLKDFYDGAFRLAIETGVPVLPVVGWDAKYLLPQAQISKIRPGIVTYYFLKPISTEGLTEADVPALRDRVFKLISDQLSQIQNAEIHPSMG